MRNTGPMFAGLLTSAEASRSNWATWTLWRLPFAKMLMNCRALCPRPPSFKFTSARCFSSAATVAGGAPRAHIPQSGDIMVGAFRRLTSAPYSTSKSTELGVVQYARGAPPLPSTAFGSARSCSSSSAAASPLFPRVRVMIRGLAFGGRAASQRAGIFVASSEAFMLTSRRTMAISPDSAAHATAPIPDLVDMQASIEGKRKWDTKSSALREGAGAPMKSPYLAARYRNQDLCFLSCASRASFKSKAPWTTPRHR
mmetsp:Transcript_24075/g.56682  ORF Transcript_24075/g.56682 Transcript_24075/m.56682 type:complete len:255 (-) Transcript_24075:528-1292(-)